MTYADELLLVGRVLFGGYFLMQAYHHFAHAGMLSGYAQSKGVPSSKLAVFVGGILLLVGGAGVVLGAFVPWAVLALAVFLVPVTFKMHAYWKVVDPMAKMGDRVNFWKNLALLGAALSLLAISAPWPYAL